MTTSFPTLSYLSYPFPTFSPSPLPSPTLPTFSCSPLPSLSFSHLFLLPPTFSFTLPTFSCFPLPFLTFSRSPLPFPDFSYLFLPFSHLLLPFSHLPLHGWSQLTLVQKRNVSHRIPTDLVQKRYVSHEGSQLTWSKTVTCITGFRLTF